MADLNKVILIGRLTADPELRHTASNLPVTSFSIAVNRRFQRDSEQRTADFINVVAWRNNAEFVSKYFRKGQSILVIGSLQSRSYEDKEGKKRTAFEVVADEIQFAEPKRDGASSSASEMTFSGTAPVDDFQQIADDDDLPF